jgi:diaminopimelate epimerase
MRFEKWQGLGNDFILVEDEVSPQRAAALCDRHLGIGADGLLIVDRSGASVGMVVLNADGSRPEMCGNGLRCVVGWEAERSGQQSGELTVRTDAGERLCSFVRSRPGSYRVSATMGAAKVGRQLAYPTADPHRFTRVDVGNPHAVCFDRVGEQRRAELGPALERHVEGGINVEFCRLCDQPARIEVAVWERGVGWTRACGTGACAAAAAAAHAGKVPFDKPVEVVLPGGSLQVTVETSSFALRLCGPAERVFAGEIRH